MLIHPRPALAAGCLLVLATACGGDSSGPPAVSTVDVTGPSSDVIVGQSAQLTATAKDAKGNAIPDRPVTWSSSSSAIATVSTGGLVTGVAPGSATITATIDGKSGTRSMNVLPPPVASVSVIAQVAAIQVGTTTQLTTELRAASNNLLTGRTVAWTTSDGAIASVSNTGLVTGIAAGTVMITATSEGKSGSAQILVTSGNPADAPQITAVSPSPLVQGQPATITGTKFGASAGANVVRVGGVAAVVTAATETSLQIVVPNLNCKPTGPVTVDVTVGGLTSPPRSHPFDAGPTFSLAQGQQRLFTNPAEFCLTFGPSSANESYLIGVQSVSENVTSVTPAKVTAEAAAGASVAPSLAIASAPVFSASLANPLADARSIRLANHRAVEARLVDQDRAWLAPRFGALRAARSKRKLAANASAQLVPTVPGSVKVGDVVNIRMPDRTKTSTCTNFIPVSATVKMIGARGIFLEDTGNPTGGFSPTDYQALSDQFDSQIYATDVAYFGEPTDSDGNSRIVIVITKEVNKIANLLGQVFSADLVDTGTCPSSNEGEFFYGKAPDPDGTLGTAYKVADALLDAPLIIAHEFAHIIQLGRRLNFEQATAFQSTWELEGQATFAEEVNGYAATGLTPGQNLGFAVAFNDPVTQPISWFVDPFVDLVVYYGFRSQTARTVGAPEQCSWLTTRSQGNDGPCLTGREVYGVPWSFLRWMSDHFGSQFPNGEKELHQRLIDNEFTGYATISSVIGQPIDVLLAQWAAMLYVDDRIGNVDPKLTLKSWNLFGIEQRLVETAKLTPYARQFTSFTDQVSVRGGSSAYFIVSGSGRPATGIRVRDAADGPLPGAMRMWVVRLQ